ncbi:hypothetical protein LTR08_006349 [Meristemomyces frigidus]|nr:hypothetical protein LTR08_006349 [Meristemomyces frigidus]
MPLIHFKTISCVLLALGAAAVAHHASPPSLDKRAASSGCGKAHTPGYHYHDSNGNFSVVSGDVERYYAVQVPEAYDADHSYALIFDYHGNSDNSTIQYNNSQYFNYAAAQQYLIVYPQGYNRSFQGPTYAVPGIDDLQFTTDLLAHIESDYCIDSDHVYASGKSNGGGFVDTLACSDHGDSFAAFAMASAALYTDLNRTACNKKRAILESHGDKDTKIPYVGKKSSHGGPLPNVGEWVTWWGERNCGDDANADATGDLGGYNMTSYSCGNYENVTQHYHFAQLGHCWPDAQGDNYDAGKLNSQFCSEVRVVDYTSVVLDFFAKWDLGSAPGN